MRLSPLLLVLAVLAPFGAIPTVLLGQAGTADPEYSIGINNIVESLAIEPNGAAVVGGSFTAVGGVNRRFVARINVEGTLDPVFNPGSGSTVYAGAVQEDGNIILAGVFGQFGPDPRVGLARLNTAGALDTSFANPEAGGTLRVALQPDGKMLIGGDFTMVAGEPRTFLARLNANGTLDRTFEAVLNASVYSISVQPDGMIIIGGSFTTVNGQTRNRIARLHPDGGIDNTFGASVGDTGNSVEITAIQADGKILIGGKFRLVNGATRRCLARLNTNGTLDSGFNPNFEHSQNADNAVVLTTALQCDGKIIVGGYFTRVGALARLAVARLNPSGSVDTGFSAGATSDSAVQAIGVQVDGKVIVGGAFPSIGGATRTNVARLLNNPATQTLSVPSRARVEWLRGGSSPEASWVTFQLSSDGGSSWVPLGSGTRLNGGWEITGLTLPPAGHIRAKALVACGKTAGLVESISAFSFPVPEIAVEQPEGFDLPSGGNSGFGAVDVGSSADRGFKIKNIGTADLTGLGFTIEGANASEFSVLNAASGPVLPGESVTFTIRFSPVGTGVRTATLHIGSDDEDEGSFDIVLTGQSPIAGTLDGGFAPVRLDGSLTASLVQPDGKVVIAGDFTTVSGQPRNRLARLNADSTPEGLTTFNPGEGADGQVYAVALQPDGKLLIAGQFKHFDGQPRTALARVHADGSLEGVSTFNPGMIGTPDGAAIYALAIQPDGKILIGGSFPSINGQNRNNVARLNPDGTLESLSTFNVGTGADFIVFSLVVQADGKILVAGRFGSVNEQRRVGIARLNSNGTLESTATFNPGTGPDGSVDCVAVQADGKILIGGDFINVNGQPRSHLARLHPDGSLESAETFRADTDREGRVRTMIVQSDGKILIGGEFQSVNGAPRDHFARLAPNGAVEDTGTFDPGAMPNVWISSLAMQSDGRILLGGTFLLGNHADPLRNFARLKNDPSYQGLAVPSRGRVHWSRGGSAPEVGHVFLDLSRDGGASWHPLPHGVRTDDGWEATGLKLPAKGLIRARGRTSGGMFNSSSGLVEAQTGFIFPEPEITLHDGLSAEAPEVMDEQSAVVDLGTVRQGVAAPRTFKLSNTGTADLIVTGVSAPEGFRVGLSSDLPGVVAPNAFLTIRLDLTGLETGVFEGELLIANNDEDEASFSFPVGGTVVAPEVVVYDGVNTNAPELSDGQPAAVDFGIVRQGSPVMRSFTVANAGTAPLLLGAVSFPAGYTVLDLPPLPTSLEVGQSLTFAIRIDAAQLGPAAGSVALTTDDIDEPSFDFIVTGMVVTPEIAVHDGATATTPELGNGQPAAVDFGMARQGTPAARSFTVANTGSAPLLVSGLVLPPGFTTLSPLPEPMTIEINQSLTFQIWLEAVTLGTFGGSVLVMSDDLDEAVFSFPVTGMVVTPEITVHEGDAGGPELSSNGGVPVDFGPVRLGMPETKTFTIANRGTASLSLGSLTAYATEQPMTFALLNEPTLPTVVDINGIVAFQVRQLAEVAGPTQANVRVISDDLDEPVFDFRITANVVTPEISVHAGDGVTAPQLIDGQSPAVSFGDNVQGTPGTRTFTIVNTGTANLLVSHVTVPTGYESSGLPVLPLTVGLNSSLVFQVSLTSLVVDTHAGSVVIGTDDHDEALFDFPVAGTVFVPNPRSVVVSTSTVLNRQTGLREQTIRVSNDTTAIVPAFDLVIRGLPAGVEVYNASSTRSDGSVVVHVIRPMGPHTVQDIVIEYSSANRQPVVVNPQLSTEVVLTPPDQTVPDGGGTFLIDRVNKLPSGEMLLEFISVPGRLYQIQYSKDGRTWKDGSTRVRAAGNRTQWIDRGPPRTESAPSEGGNRLYRVKDVTP